jgi:hypothetical protein
MTEDSPVEKPRQYGDAINTDPELSRLAQARTDEEALAIEAEMLVETDPLLEGSIEEIEEESVL